MQAFERIEFPEKGELHLKNLPLESGKPVRVIVVPMDDPADEYDVEDWLWAAIGLYAVTQDEDMGLNWEEVFGV
jgi:hypothetical protein